MIAHRFTSLRHILLLPGTVLTSSCSEANHEVVPEPAAPAVAVHAPPPVATCSNPSWQEDRSFGHPAEPVPGAFSLPSGVATDPKNDDVYVSDNLFHRIQRFDGDGRFLNLWNLPVGIAIGVTVDPTDSTVLVAIPGKQMLIRFTPDGQELARLGADLPADKALFEPQDASVDPTSGRIYVMNNDSYVTVLERDGRFVRRWHAGVRARPEGHLTNYDKSLGIAVSEDGKQVFVANSGAYRAAVFTPEGKLLHRWAEASSSKEGELRWCRGIAAGSDGRIYVADTDNERAQIFSTDGTFIKAFRGPHDEEPIGFHPRAIDYNPKTGKVWVAASYANRVDRFDADGNYEMSIGQAQPGRDVLNDARGVVADPANGRVFVTSRRDHVVKRFSTDGTFESEFYANAGKLEGFPVSWTVQQNHQFPTPLALGTDGTVWLIRQGYHYPDDPTPGHFLRHYSIDGEFLGALEDKAMAGYMMGLDIDPRNGDFYITSTRSHNVLVYSADGQPKGTIGDGDGLKSPTGIAVDPLADRVYVVDTGNSRVRVYGLDGSVVGGWGKRGTANGEFRFSKPAGLDVDECGRVYVADFMNRRVQIFDTDGNFIDQILGSWRAGEGKPKPWDVDVVGDEMYVVGGDRVTVLRRTAAATAPEPATTPEPDDELPAEDER